MTAVMQPRCLKCNNLLVPKPLSALVLVYSPPIELDPSKLRLLSIILFSARLGWNTLCRSSHSLVPLTSQLNLWPDSSPNCQWSTTDMPRALMVSILMFIKATTILLASSDYSREPPLLPTLSNLLNSILMSTSLDPFPRLSFWIDWPMDCQLILIMPRSSKLNVEARIRMIFSGPLVRYTVLRI